MSPAREPALTGQTVVVIGGSAGIGLETARQARDEGADVILAGRNPDRLTDAADQVGAKRTATFDANDTPALEEFFGQLDGPIDHVMVTAGGPYYASLADMDFDEARRALQEHPMLMAGVARYASPNVRPGGALLFMGGTGGRNPRLGIGITSAMTVALPALRAFDYLTRFGHETVGRLVPAAIRRFVKEDFADGGVLTATLLEYVAADLNVKAAAERLHLHANTAHYRLARIEDRTGCNLRRLADVLDLLIAIRADQGVAEIAAASAA